jgi:hypothetical protein
MAACTDAWPNVVGCWWLDGTGGFPRTCNGCSTLVPTKHEWANDWAGRFD